jgi:hypothetical protein
MINKAAESSIKQTKSRATFITKVDNIKLEAREMKDKYRKEYSSNIQTLTELNNQKRLKLREAIIMVLYNSLTWFRNEVRSSIKNRYYIKA